MGYIFNLKIIISCKTKIILNKKKDESKFVDLASNYYLLSRRKSNSASNLKIYTTRYSGINSPCFHFEETNDLQLIYISIPYLENCYYFTIYNQSLVHNNRKLLNSELSLEFISLQTLNDVLNSLGISEITCDQNNSTSPNFFTSAKNLNCSNGFVLKKFFHLAVESSHWLGKLKRYLSTTFYALMLHSYSPIHLKLEISCWDSFEDVADLIEKCLSFYDGEHCAFECNSDCGLVQNSVWQVQRFRYAYSSNFCKAVKHSNLNGMTGFLILGSQIVKENYVLLNNKIRAEIWPPIGITNFYKMNVSTSFQQNYFYFQNYSTHFDSSKIKNFQSILVVKAIFNNKTSNVNLNVYQ